MSSIISSLKGIGGKLSSTFYNVLDRLVLPEKRAEISAKVKDWAISNPKLAAFLLAQIALTGFPLFLFITFSITVFLFALIAALLIGVLAAVFFTVLMVGVALLVILPTIFITTFSATFIFLCGLAGYYILKWFNDGGVPASDSTAIGEKLNRLTGGRMSLLMDDTRQKTDDARTGVDQTLKSRGGEQNGSVMKEKKSEENGSAEKHGKDSKDGNAPDVGKATSTAKEMAIRSIEDVQKRLPKLASGTTDGAGTVKAAAS